MTMAYDIGEVAFRRHEVDEQYTSFGCLEGRLQDQGVTAITPRDLGSVYGSYHPAAFSGSPRSAAKQLSESNLRQAQPIDRAFRRPKAAVSQSPISA